MSEIYEKSEWLHSEYVKLFEPFGNRILTENEQKFLKNKMNEIKKEADKKFGV